MTTGKSTAEHIPNAPREATFGMKRAAEVAGVSVSTIRRNRELLRQHGAVLDPDGWKVPMSALIASGLMRRQTPPDVPTSAPKTAPDLTDDDALDRLRELEREALELRHRAELAEQRAQAAEALAEERARTLEIERRMLTAGTPSNSSAPAAEPNQASSPQPPSVDPLANDPVPRSRWRRWLGMTAPAAD